MEFTAEELRALMIFHPVAFERREAMRSSGGRFVHYSSAEAAFHIIKSKRMRLRNAAVMNDFMEIEHGAECLSHAWRSPVGEQCKAFLNECFPGLPNEVAQRIDAWLPVFRTDTYLASISEHDDTEDELGRLSMWRAYGGSSGVAMVLNQRVFLSVSNALAAYTSPVSYLSKDEFVVEFERVAKNMEMTKDFLLGLGREEVSDHLFHAFRFSILCTKHPGFREEREWRIIYSPAYEKSDRIESSVELVRGIPQIVQSIPLKDYPDEGLVGAEPASLVNRVIVGPTEHPRAIRDAMIKLLRGAAVEAPEQKVVTSAIPLRQ